MAPRLLIPTRVIPRCSNKTTAWSLSDLHRARGIAQTHLAKKAEGEERWKQRAEKIASGEIPHTWDVLQERGYIKDVAGTPEKIKEIMRIKRTGAYVGVDPTADSMHLGHLLPFMALFWLWMHGYPATTLIGGATARIGDPTDRLESREILSNADISKNVAKIHQQLTRIWANVQRLREKYGYPDDWAAKHHMLNNSMWLQGLSLYDFSKRLARYTRIGPMLSRDTVKRKMTEGDGMSLGEFMYPLFQGWDFWHLYNKMGTQLQIGGSDQYGNIVSGIDTLKTVRDSEEAPYARMPTEWQHDPFGFTVPLLTDSSGAKFGKSAGNAVWLDEYKTSPFDLYGYLMRRSDDEVERLLKLFTFMPMTQIQSVMAEHVRDPAKRTAQHHLAFEVLSLVHGTDRALQEANQHAFRFGGSLPKIFKDPSPQHQVTPNNAPRSDIQLPRSVINLSPAKILQAVGLASSGSEGQRLVTAQGAYVAGSPGQQRGLVPGNLTWTPIKMWFPGETSKFVIDEKLLILRKGKHNIRIVELVSDEEWKESGRFYPGEPFQGKTRRTLKKLQDLTSVDGRKLPMKELRERLAAGEIDLATEREKRHVANNPDIELPTKDEVRNRNKQKKSEGANDGQSRSTPGGN